MQMNYFVAGTNDMDRAISFYDRFFGHMGIKQAAQTDRMTYWVSDSFAFAIAHPYDQEPAAPGNGTMIGFAVRDANQVQALHALVLSLGGSDEGQPGPRGPYYSAYVRDLDQNKICISARQQA